MDSRYAVSPTGEGNVFSNNSNYWKLSPEKIFFKLLSTGCDEEAENLGTAFKLDILHLYEIAGDEHFFRQDYGRALT